MDENLKYYKLSGEGIEANIVVACKPDEVERLFKKFEGYTLEETECPKDAQIVSAEPRINPEPFMLRNPYAYLPRDPMEREAWEGKCCDRCKNRYNLRSDFCYKHQNDDRCYRFKLER